MVQVNSDRLTVRLKFRKTGSLQYVSHLDLVRTMNKIIVRAKLPLYYSEGFNPKPKMVFAAPLSIGTESLAEYMDLRLSEYVDPELVMKRLNSNMTEEMQITEAYYPDSKFTDLKWMTYSISIKTSGANLEYAKRCEDILLSDVVEVLKNTKSGEKNVDIRPLIKSVTSDYDGEYMLFRAVLSADQSTFLNPELIIKVLRDKAGVLSGYDLTEEYYSIMRLSAHNADMTEFR